MSIQPTPSEQSAPRDVQEIAKAQWEAVRKVDPHLQLIKELAEALTKTLEALVSYKHYTSEPYKQNPIYIIGSHEAETLAANALAKAEKVLHGEGK